jgi:hypothetical protein
MVPSQKGVYGNPLHIRFEEEKKSLRRDYRLSGILADFDPVKRIPLQRDVGFSTVELPWMSGMIGMSLVAVWSKMTTPETTQRAGLAKLGEATANQGRHMAGS